MKSFCRQRTGTGMKNRGVESRVLMARKSGFYVDCAGFSSWEFRNIGLLGDNVPMFCVESSDDCGPKV